MTNNARSIAVWKNSVDFFHIEESSGTGYILITMSNQSTINTPSLPRGHSSLTKYNSKKAA